MKKARKAGKSNAARKRNKQRKQDDNKQQIKQAIQWLLNSRIFDSFVLHGNTSWLSVHLVTLALLWIWSDKSKLTDAFEDARCHSTKLFGKAALSTYQGMAGALETWTPAFMPQLQIRLHELMQQIGHRRLRVGLWAAIAMDGSRGTAPRTQSNEQAFCAKNYGRGKTAKYRKKKTKGLRRRKNAKAKVQPPAPQIWITMMWHIGLGMPWCWKLGPSNSSERAHVMDMIRSGHFLKNTLFVGDAGFVGYDFWSLIIEQQHDFLVRVGGNVRLLENLGYCTHQKKGMVYCWPNTAMSTKLPPLVLRLVTCRIGKKDMFLLTSVLDESELSRQEIITLYERRWGVELEFRALKQTFERRTLRSRKSDRVLVEMEWSIFGMAVIELFALAEQLQAKPQKPPRPLSFAKCLRAVRLSLQHLTDRPGHVADFSTLLAKALVDAYERRGTKSARYHPQTKDKPSCGSPVVTRATLKHRQRLKQLDLQNAA